MTCSGPQWVEVEGVPPPLSGSRASLCASRIQIPHQLCRVSGYTLQSLLLPKTMTSEEPAGHRPNTHPNLPSHRGTEEATDSQGASHKTSQPTNQPTNE